MYEKCREILMAEFELIQNAVIIQERIRMAVTGREWAVFEDNINAMNSIEVKIEELETEREKLFAVFEAISHEQGFSSILDEKGQFYAMVSTLPENQRSDLTSIYRSLKTESIKLKLANENLLLYVNELKNTLREFFDLAFLERGGKMYTKDGTHFSHDMRSMVLNQSF